MSNYRNFFLLLILAPQLVSSAHALTAVGLTSNNALIRFEITTPGTIRAGPTAITGLQPGETLLGIDVRPSNGLLYGLGSSGRLYTINVVTAAATQVAILAADPTDNTNSFGSLSGSEFGMDFNPVNDRMRVVSDSDQNLRINPDNGLVFTDGAIAFAAGDTNAGENPKVTASAYLNSFAGAATTTLYGIDFTNQVLVTQNPPNNGTITTVGSGLGFTNALTISGFDIAPGNNRAFGTFTDASLPTASFLYEVSLTSGAGSSVGQIGPNTTGRVRGLALYPDNTIRFGAATYSVNENSGSVSIPVFRIGSTTGPVQVDYATSAGSATPGFDYEETSGTIAFANGESVKAIQVPLVFNAAGEFDESFTVTMSHIVSPNPSTDPSAVLATPPVTTVTIVDSASSDATLPAKLIYGISLNNALFSFMSNAPGTILSTVTVTGLQLSEKILGIDFRPATGVLYGLGSTSRLYTINTATGAATQVGTAGTFTLSGARFGFNFNPVADRIRVVSDTAQNLRLNPNDGTLTGTDGDLNFDPDTDSIGPDTGDANEGHTPQVSAVAYTNPDADSTTNSTLYDLDSSLNSLLIQSPPNFGTLLTVGQTFNSGVVSDLPQTIGFDIALGNIGFVSTSTPGTNTLFRINLSNGQLTTVGAINLADGVRALAVAPRGTIEFSAPTYSVGESGPVATITVNRVRGSEGTVSVQFATIDGTATAGSDYTDSTQILTFGQGVTTQLVQIPLNDDSTDEVDETVTLTLSNPTGDATLGAATSATLTIVDDDVATSPTPTATPTATPTPEPTATPGQAVNISTRMRVLTEFKVMIGGFFITGSEPKTVIIRARGPSLGSEGVEGELLNDPTLEVHQEATVVASNDDWKLRPDGSSQQEEIEGTGIPPSDDREAALVVTLAPGPYTAIVAGKDGTTGIGLVEVYDLATGADSKLANISTRGFVETGSNVIIGGFIIRPLDGASAKLVIRAIGPSLSGQGVEGALEDPTLEVHDVNGALLGSNDDWAQDDGAAEIENNHIAPTDPRESATLQTLAPGNYTAIVRGKDDTTGVGLVEVYALQ